MSDTPVKKMRKPLPTEQEKTVLMRIREVFHETKKDQKVCIVIPEETTATGFFGHFYKSLKGRLSMPNVEIINITDLTCDHLEVNNVVIDLSDMCVIS